MSDPDAVLGGAGGASRGGGGSAKLPLAGALNGPAGMINPVRSRSPGESPELRLEIEFDRLDRTSPLKFAKCSTIPVEW